MATNLRLRPETEKALREKSLATGRSQQDLIRLALDEYLGLTPLRIETIDDLIASGIAKAPRPLRAVTSSMKLPSGVNSLDLLDREDRF